MVESVYRERKNRVINKSKKVNFSGPPGYYLISVVARVKSSKHISPDPTDHENLVVQIDKTDFPGLGKKNKLINSPAAFKGDESLGTLKTIYFLVYLSGNKHELLLKAYPAVSKPILEDLQIWYLNVSDTFVLQVDKEAEDADRRPWVSVILRDLPVASLSAKITYKKRKRDSDDVQVIVNGQVQNNQGRSIKHFLWSYIGSLLPNNNAKTEAREFKVNLSKGLHYIEFKSDRMPKLHHISFNFGDDRMAPPRIPTLDDPKWTGNFGDDTETMILARAIYGETENQSDEAKIAVGWSIRNRIEDSKHRWGKTYHEVILQPNQYSPFRTTDHNYPKVIFPNINNPDSKESWQRSYDIAKKVINNEVADPTNGANHFYSTIINPPPWADDSKLIIQVGITRFYKL